jgi:chromosome segregation ATPase
VRISNIPRTNAKQSSKLRCMPAKGTVSSVYLRMHQLANQKERSERELQALSDRTQELVTLIGEVERELVALQSEVARQTTQSEIKTVNVTPRSLFKLQSASGKSYQHMVLDY